MTVPTSSKFVIAAALALAAANAHAVVFQTVSTYDSTSNANAVDFNASYASSTGGATAANVTTAAVGGDLTPGVFNTAVATAFAAGLGGVIDVDNTTTAVNTTSIANVTGTYGVGGTGKTLNFTSGAGLFVNSNSGARTPISGTVFFNKNAGNNDYTFNVGAFTGITTEGVVGIGLTFLSRDSTSFGVVSATATFTDGSTVTSSRTVAEASGLGDTFFGFTAPAGTAITQVALDVPGTTNFGGVDDLAFITSTAVPEPASLGLAALAGCTILRRVRRR